MSNGFFLHLRQNWPLVAAILVLFSLLAFALLTGALPSNQGNILKSRDPDAYWRWLRRLAVLLMLSLVVLVGSYFLGSR